MHIISEHEHVFYCSSPMWCKVIIATISQLLIGSSWQPWQACLQVAQGAGTYLNRKPPLPRHTLGPCQRKAVQGLSDYKPPDTLLSNSQHNRVKQVTLKWSGTDGEKYGWAKGWPKSGKTCGDSLRYLAVVSYANEVFSYRYKGARKGGEEREGREGGQRDRFLGVDNTVA